MFDGHFDKIKITVWNGRKRSYIVVTILTTIFITYSPCIATSGEFTQIFTIFENYLNKYLKANHLEKWKLQNNKLFHEISGPKNSGTLSFFYINQFRFERKKTKRKVVKITSLLNQDTAWWTVYGKPRFNLVNHNFQNQAARNLSFLIQFIIHTKIFRCDLQWFSIIDLYHSINYKPFHHQMFCWRSPTSKPSAEMSNVRWSPLTSTGSIFSVDPSW